MSEASDQLIAISSLKRGTNISKRYDYQQDLITKSDILIRYRNVRQE